MTWVTMADDESYNNVYCAENKGKTLHLLKKQSKAVPQNRKRVKRDIFASPLEFQQLHPDLAEEQKHEEPEMQVDEQPNLGYVPADGGPNQIGNAEDGPVLPDNLQASAFQDHEEVQQQPRGSMYPDGGGNEMNFRPITPRRTEAELARRTARRNKSKERPP